MITQKEVRKIANRAKMGDEDVEFALLIGSYTEPQWDYPDLVTEEMDDD